jgi:hypothetical protein
MDLKEVINTDFDKSKLDGKLKIAKKVKPTPGIIFLINLFVIAI